MLSKILLALALVWHVVIFSQRTTCTEEDPIMDMNSITKCSFPVKPNSKGTTIRVRVSSRRRKYRKGVSKLKLYKRKKTVKTLKKSPKIVEKTKKNKELSEVLAVKSSKKTPQKIEENKVSGIQSNFDRFPYEIVDVKPSFNTCKGLTTSLQEKCFRKQVLKHVMKNFRYPKKAYFEGIQGRVIVQFVIDENGNISRVISRGPIDGKELENEAKRIIKTLPKFPVVGEVEGHKVKTVCNFPITFTIPGMEIVKKIPETTPLNDIVAFVDTDEIPQFKECANSQDKKACFNTQLTKYIAEYFAYPKKAVSMGIEGEIQVSFIINKHGNVANVKVMGSEKGKETLEEEAKRLVLRLPNFVPGKLNNKLVNVKYVIPVSFVLDK